MQERFYSILPFLRARSDLVERLYDAVSSIVPIIGLSAST